jgi:ATP-dependent protease ClpP protease subunit
MAKLNPIKATAVAAGIVIATSTGAGAHPFAFDTSKMVGFHVVTAEDGAMEAKDMVVIEYSGPIAFPMAENLKEIWTEIEKNSRFQLVVLRLNSPGGTQVAGEDVIKVLEDIRAHVTLATLVGEHDMCASMCIPIYIQGETRHASPASVWMFHGATRQGNIPSLSLTMRYVDYFRERAVGAKFIDSLVEKNYLTTPGEYWVAGVQLAGESDIVTKLDPCWKPMDPDPGPQPGIRSGV